MMRSVSLFHFQVPLHGSVVPLFYPVLLHYVFLFFVLSCQLILHILCRITNAADWNFSTPSCLISSTVRDQEIEKQEPLNDEKNSIFLKRKKKVMRERVWCIDAMLRNKHSNIVGRSRVDLLYSSSKKKFQGYSNKKYILNLHNKMRFLLPFFNRIREGTVSHHFSFSWFFGCLYYIF